MARKPSIPAYRLHRQSGQAIVTLRSPSGRRRDYLLGQFNSPESHAEYTRLLTEWQQGNQQLPNNPFAEDMTVNELMLAFWKHCQGHYVDEEGKPTSEQTCYRSALRPVKELYGNTPAAKFGPIALKSVRSKMIDMGHSRETINHNISRVRQMFKWAVSEELLPSSVYEALRTVTGLQAFRSKAKENKKVLPVSDDLVKQTIPYLSRTLAAMVRVQRLPGARPSEICDIRVAEIDMSEETWVYQPSRHKNKWRGMNRSIGIGPKAQAILKEFFTDNPDDYLFSPQRAQAERYANLRTNRQTPVQPSQVSRKKAKPKRKPRDRYTKDSYNAAIRRACRQGNLPRWKPNQLRHTFGTEVRKLFGLEGAQVGLGHESADTTEIYAEIDIELAKKIAAQIG